MTTRSGIQSEGSGTASSFEDSVPPQGLAVRWLRAFVVAAALWFVWFQTIGRIPGSLHYPWILLFDLSCVVLIGLVGGWPQSSGRFLFRARFISIDGMLAPWRELRALPGVSGQAFFILALVLLATMLFTWIFQVPIDWDGADYHLPPMVEAFQNGFWSRSENPYFAARNYPHAANGLHLWWLTHFAGILGARGWLLFSGLIWCVGWLVSRELVGRNAWVSLFWLTLPLVQRQAMSGYADLPALVFFLLFLFFFRRREGMVAALALGLFSASKFSNMVGAAALVLLAPVLARLWDDSSWQCDWRTSWRKNLIQSLGLGSVVVLFALPQLLENVWFEGRPLGPLRCTLLGRDWCQGDRDPLSLVVSPMVPIPADASWIEKIRVGWTPSQWVVGLDFVHGGFGWAFVLPCLMLLGLLLRPSVRNGLREHSELRRWLQLGSLVLVVELVIPAHWYVRYHLVLGWFLAMGGAVLLNGRGKWWGVQASSEGTAVEAKLEQGVVVLVLLALGLQVLWLLPQRTWFLGVQDAGVGRAGVIQNLQSIVVNGVPQSATHPADRRLFQFYRENLAEITFCKNEYFRPVLGAYGTRLQTRVRWEQTPDCLPF